MIQWLQSKLVLIVAVAILISSVVGVFHHQLESMEKEELKNRCGKIARVIEKMEKADADEMRQRITFDEGSKGIYLSPEVRGDSYSIKIQTDLVRLEKDGMSVVEGLQANVHVWGPGEMNDTGELNEDEKRWRDSQASQLEIRSGEKDIELRKVELREGDAARTHIFVSEVVAH